MGMDIHMSIVKNGKVIANNIFDGRNSTWFNNMMVRGNDPEYDFLPNSGGVSPQAPKDISEEYNRDDMFGRFYISVADFKEWFKKYNPHLNAGWIRIYDKWVWDKKGLIPDCIKYDDVMIEIPENSNACEWCFVEYEKEYDCSLWLNDYLIKNEIPDDADITYCFDW